jgi:hypothetical protein
MMHFDPAAIALLEADFRGIALRLLRPNGNREGSAVTADRRFRAWFGTSATVATMAWTLLRSDDEWKSLTKAKERFLWALMLLKRYKTEENLAASAGGVDKKTFRKWAWHFVDMISFLEPDVVSTEFEESAEFDD